MLFAYDLLLRPRARQNIRHRVIPLVTFVWEDPFAGLAHGNLGAPRSGKSSGIVDGELVSDRIGVGAGESLGQMEVLVGPEEVVGPDEIGGIDDQRVALPMATRIAHVAADLPRRMRARVQNNDAQFVHHLLKNRDRPRRLNNLEEIVVGCGRHR